jgi:hypothetical protein
MKLSTYQNPYHIKKHYSPLPTINIQPFTQKDVGKITKENPRKEHNIDI